MRVPPDNFTNKNIYLSLVIFTKAIETDNQ
jgi:hypothetical protein